VFHWHLDASRVMGVQSPGRLLELQGCILFFTGKGNCTVVAHFAMLCFPRSAMLPFSVLQVAEWRICCEVRKDGGCCF